MRSCTTKISKKRNRILKKEAWNFEAKVCISTFAIKPDTNESGWGATNGVTLIGGTGFAPDKANHIQFLELLAIKHASVNYRGI